MHAHKYFQEVAKVAQSIDIGTVEQLAAELVALREREGRLFLLGVGGSAGNCGHAVNDFRKLCGIEAYAPTDNVSELTARTNDEGWETVFAAWLKTSRATSKDAVFVFSVGGGNLEKNVSANIVAALKEAKQRGMKVSASSGATAATPSGSATAWSWFPPSRPRASRRIPKPSRRWSGIASCRTRRCSRSPPSGSLRRVVRRAVFLDRDGVLNRAVLRAGRPYPPDSPEALEILPGVREALERLRAAGFFNVVVTNQPDVATGKQRREVVEAMHARLGAELPIDAFKVCYHIDADGAPAASPGRGCCSRLPRARHRSRLELPGRRPLARRRGGPGRGLRSLLHRLWL